MKRYKIILLIVILFSGMYAVKGIAAITGKVTNISGNPVSGATVTYTDESKPENRFSDITDNHGRYTIDLGTIWVENITPSTFHLGQNYPNPFNPTTTISFTLDVSSHVTLSIFNIMGQKITTLINRELDAGSNAVTWDGRDEHGNHVSSGIYLYRLKAGDRTKTKKMLLLDGGGVLSGSKTYVDRSVDSSGWLNMNKIADDTVSYTVTITHDSILPFKKTGVSIADGQNLDFVVSLKSDKTDIYGITFITIPSGTFRMGDVENYGRSSYEIPVHTVTLSSFKISIYEITQEQFQSVMGENPSQFKSGDNYPVESVSWYDAARFCNKLSELMGFEKCYTESGNWECDINRNGFRLPTEAEWEYSCRAGTETYFYTGNNISSDGFTSTDLDRAGWYWFNWGEKNKKTQIVGVKEPNAFGLYDMHGNISEWCNDWFVSYTSENQINPTGIPSGDFRILRGGSLNHYAWYCRSASREFSSPSRVMNCVGFRIVRINLIKGTSNYNIKGQVLVNEQDLADVSVRINGPGTVKTVLTGSDGRYEFNELYSGNHIVSYEKKGYIFDRPSVRILIQDDDVYIDPINGTKINQVGGEIKTYKNITFISIPSGTFRMGDVENYGKYPHEMPVHKVSLSSFEMSIYEITQGQYQSVVGNNPSGVYGIGDNYPVYFVSWYDAAGFCNKLSEQMGYDKCYTESGNWDCNFSKNGFRLPTEAEWEYACRAGTETNFYIGNNISSDGLISTDLDKAGWYKHNWGQENNKSHIVGEKEPNAFGLYDMHGNVWEWCNDWYGWSYTSDSQTNPTGPSSGSDRVNRGGCWLHYAWYSRSAFRVGCSPTSEPYIMGFRVVRRP